MSKRNTAPAHFSDAMKKFHAEVTGQYDLEADALLTFETACDCWDRAQEARKAIAVDGIIIGGKRNPAVDIECQYTAMFLRAMRQLGLDVVAPGPMGRPPGSGR